MNKRKSGVKIQGQMIRTIRFADNIAILEESKDELEKNIEEDG